MHELPRYPGYDTAVPEPDSAKRAIDVSGGIPDEAGRESELSVGGDSERHRRKAESVTKKKVYIVEKYGLNELTSRKRKRERERERKLTDLSGTKSTGVLSIASRPLTKLEMHEIVASQNKAVVPIFIVGPTECVDYRGKDYILHRDDKTKIMYAYEKHDARAIFTDQKGNVGFDKATSISWTSPFCGSMLKPIQALLFWLKPHKLSYMKATINSGGELLQLTPWPDRGSQEVAPADFTPKAHGEWAPDILPTSNNTTKAVETRASLSRHQSQESGTLDPKFPSPGR